MTFDPCDRATWPDVLLADEVSAIYRRRPGGVKKACQERTFVPAPAWRHPWRWHRADVLRHLDGRVSVRRAS